MKINRLFEIVYILLDRDRITAKELAERFEVSTRTIYRDVEDLSAAGIPIYMSKGKNGGISLLPNYILNKTVLTEEEKRNTIAALESLNAMEGFSMEDTLVKLSALFGEKSTGYFEIDYTDWGRLIKDQFEKSKEAIISSKLLSFDYLSSQNTLSRRKVEPYRLWFKDRTWYLKAFCLEKEDIRIFRFSRMRNVRIEEETYTPRDIISLKYSDISTSYPTVEVTMRVTSNMVYRLLDEFADVDVIKNEDGSFTVTMNYIEDDWLYGYILSFGPSATVIKPARIREIIKRKLKENLDNYL